MRKTRNFMRAITNFLASLRFASLRFASLRFDSLCSVQIIYVSPFPLDDEILDYTKKLLSISGCPSASSRFTVLVPEMLSAYPSHFPLSSLLRYSPRTMHRIKQLTKNRRGYIVPGCCGYQEKILALALNMPLYGSEVRWCALKGVP